MALEIALLGPPRITRDGARVSFDTRKATALLAHLALAERARPREALCDLLWPGRDPAHARGALRRTLSTLRGGLGEEWLETEGDAVALRHGPGLRLDVERFRSLSGPGAPVEALEHAAALFRGRLLDGFALRDSAEWDAWQLAEAEALDRELGSVLGRLVAPLADRGEYGRAIGFARRWLETEPLHEPAHRALIRLHAWSGDRRAALRQYRACVRTLSEELGVGPLEETSALFEQVSEGTLAPPAHRASEPEPRDGPAPAPAVPPLVGRRAELAALVTAHRRGGPDGRLAVIEGEAGIGKTRLAHELTIGAGAVGAKVLAARCHEDEVHLPYAPVAALLAQAARDGAAWAGGLAPQRLADASLLVPELAALRPDIPAPVAREAPGAEARLLEGVSAVLTAATAGAAPGIVAIDDAQHADAGTLALLGYLGRRLERRSLLLLVAWRGEEVPPGHRLRRLTAELERAGAADVVRPGRLGEADVTELVRALRPDGAGMGLARRAFRESEGLPLFATEYLTVAAGPGPEGGEGRGEPAGGARGILGARLGGLGGTAQQVLGAGAVIGRAFDFDTLRAVGGRSEEETVEGLEELLARGVVREDRTAEPAYGFAHEQLRRLAYEELSLARRRLLHRRAADALPRGAGSAALVARHLQAAGDDERAAHHHLEAAEHAASVLAHADAAGHLDAALALGAGDRPALLERAGDLRTLAGDYRGALSSYEAAAAERAGEALAAVEHKLAGVHARQGRWSRAEARLTAALDAAPPRALALRARVLADLALVIHHLGREDAAARAGEALRLAQAAADARARAQSHNILGVLARSRGNRERARAELERSVHVASELGDAPAQAAALNNLALVERDAGRLGRALELTEAALDLAVREGDRHREAALENNLADLHHAAGRPDAAMEHLKRAVAIFSEVGADEASRMPEIWKLVSW